jgi:hypothetical protein
LKAIIHNGQVMTLDHLTPFTFTCPCPDIERDLSIRAQFANHHCYSRKYDPAIHSTEEILFTEAKDRHRVFCPDRYELSRRLPKLLPELPNKRVHQTSQSRNYIYVVPLDILGIAYEIYFMLQRAAPEDAADLRLTVESAYRSDRPNLRKRPNAIRFAVLAHKVLTNQPVRFAPR